MTLSEFIASKTYKNIMKFVYGWGAAVVIAGALFKIMHWPGSGIMLVTGMGAEVLVFFLSAFEPLHEEVDWTLVYPELAGMTDSFEPIDRADRDKRYQDNRLLDIGYTPPARHEPFDYGQGGGVSGQSPSGSGPSGFSDSFSGEGLKGMKSIEKFDSMLAKANLTPEMFQKLGEGIHKVGDIANKFHNIEETLAATDEFGSNISGASKAVENLSVVFNNSTDVLKDSVGTLSESYIRSSEMITNTGETVSGAVQDGIKTMVGALNNAGSKLIESMNNSETEMRQVYQTMINELNRTAENVRESSKGYMDNVELQNKNLSQINSLYELHIQNITQYTNLVQDLSGKGSQMVEGFNEGLQHTLAYRDELAKLNNQLVQLNEVYGSMLSTITVNE